MEIERIAEIEQATGVNRKEVLRLGVSVLFLAGIRASGGDAVFHDPRHDAALVWQK